MTQYPSHSPFRDGFAALWHEPALFAAELTWRWCFGLSAWALAIISAVLFLDSLKISRGDEFLLGTFQPRLLLEAVRHIFRGSLNRFVLEQAVLIVGLIALWAFAATAGRAATLRRLVAIFGADEERQTLRWEFEPILVLNLVRAMWSLIAVAAMIFSLVAGLVLVRNGRGLRAAFFLVVGIGLAWTFRVVLNGVFGLAPLFCIRNGAGAPEALSQAVDFSSRQAGRLLGMGIGFAFLRAVWAVTMFLAVLAPLRLAHHIARGWIALIMAVVSLIYFAGADWLYLARLGACVALAEDDSHPAAVPPEISPEEPLLPPDIAPIIEPV